MNVTIEYHKLSIERQVILADCRKFIRRECAVAKMYLPTTSTTGRNFTAT